MKIKDWKKDNSFQNYLTPGNHCHSISNGMLTLAVPHLPTKVRAFSAATTSSFKLKKLKYFRNSTYQTSISAPILFNSRNHKLFNTVSLTNLDIETINKFYSRLNKTRKINIILTTVEFSFNINGDIENLKSFND